MWAVRVPGIPVPKPDPKCYGRGGHHRLSIDENRTGYTEWRARVTAAGRLITAQSGTLTGPVGVEITITHAFPETLNPATRTWPTKRSSGDVDKCTRLILDALTDAQLWGDDSQVVDQHTVQVYPHTPDVPDVMDRPGAVIRVWRQQ